MTRRLILSLGTLLSLGIIVVVLLMRSWDGFEYLSYNPDYPPPPDWTGPVFSLSQNYPNARPSAEDQPWRRYEPTDPEQSFDYLNAVLRYALEGNVEIDFQVAKNPIRTWYHAPWMQAGCWGREFVHGLTRELRSQPGTLHPDQTEPADTWAVSFYNPMGGYTLGQVWGPVGMPNPLAAKFPEGTVASKLLFTTASVAQAPFLDGTWEWQADIYTVSSQGPDPCDLPLEQRPRTVQTVRLLQLDLAIRDDRTPIGWVFGSFIYDAASPGQTVWDRLVPVGSMWGNDPTVVEDLNREGAFVNAALSETRINPALIGDFQGNRAAVQHFGLGGRLDGPIDSDISSCMSCHAQAAIRSQPLTASGVSPATYPLDQFRIFFRNIPKGTVPGKNPDTGDLFLRLDYSLQLATGIQNLLNCVFKPDESEGCGRLPLIPAQPTDILNRDKIGPRLRRFPG